jgi:methylmalonyl-CoA mutase N-terminal domain/subunit
LHTNSLDETYALPTEEAVRIALRTQQIIAEESGVASTIDPLAGSYFVEELTDRLEAEALAWIARIDQLGGMVAAIEQGYPQREIAASAYRFQRQLESGERGVVGVNVHASNTPDRIPTLRVDESSERAQLARLTARKLSRDASRVEATLRAVREAAQGNQNLVPVVIEAAKAYCSEQEICDVLRDVMGSHSDRPEF